MKCIVIVLAVAIIVTGCIPEPLEVTNIPAVKPQIVVSSQIVPDQSLLILLTKTIGALDASNDSDPEELLQQIAVRDARVTIEDEQGQIYALDTLGNGLYGGVSITFQVGKSYKLKVRSESMGDVEATATVQPLITFEQIEAELYYNGFNDTLAQITYAIADPETPNYYMINVQEVEQEDFTANLINPRAYTLLKDDKEFNGKVYGETFRVFPRDYKPGDTIAVTLSNISEEYFQFMKLRIDNRFSFVEFLGEPINYPSNVIGGKGFFNLYIPDVHFFIFDEE